MYWDRFDICEAHYMFAMLYHGGQGSTVYAKFAQLHRIGFSMSPCLQDPDDLSENGIEIFNQLVARHGYAV